MSFGPIELLMLRFPGNRFTGKVAPALTDLIDSDTIRVIDILFASKDKDGTLAVFEINDLDDEVYELYDPLVGDVSGLLSADDLQHLASDMENNSSAALMLFENTWAIRFVEAVADAGGEVMLNERIPRAVVEAALREPEEAQA